MQLKLNLSIGQRTALGFALMIGLVLIASGTGLLYTRTVETTVNTTRDGADQIEQVGNLQENWLAVVSTIDNLLLTRQTSLIDQRLRGELDTFNQQLDALEPGLPGTSPEIAAENARIIGDLSSLGDELTGSVNELIIEAQSGRWARAQSLRHTSMASLQRQLNEDLETLSGNIRTVVYDSADEAMSAQRDTRTYWSITAALALLLGVLAGFLTVNSITQPVAALVRTAQAIRGGDLTQRAAVNTRDEIGQLATTFNSMTEQLSGLIDHLEERVNDRTRDLQIAADVSKQITTVLDIDELLQQVVTLTARSYSLSASSVFLPTSDNTALVQAAGSDAAGQVLTPSESGVPIADDLSAIAVAARTRKTVSIPDVSEEPDYASPALLRYSRSEVAIPMLLGHRLLGVFNLQSSQPHRFHDEDLRILETLAEQIAIAVRNAQLFAETQSARETAEQANRIKSEFMANMSHELRTPLNAILNFTGFVADGVLGPVTTEQSDTLNKVIVSGEHLLSLINDILDLTKIEVGMMDLFIEEVDLNSILESLLSTAKGLIKAKPLELHTEIEPNLPRLYGDKRRIRQILLNLLSNAVKFTPRGNITLIARHQDGEILISVQDTGIGIPQDQQHVVFETFKQGRHDLQDTPGTGLGMPISKHFAEAHGGRLWFESAVGAGSTFYVTLPVNGLPSASDTNPSKPAIPTGTRLSS